VFGAFFGCHMSAYRNIIPVSKGMFKYQMEDVENGALFVKMVVERR
jgi:hypothetical protein